MDMPVSPAPAVDEREAARADLCRYLAACFYEPTPMFGEERLFDSMAQAAGQIDAALAERARRLGAAFAGEDLQTLLVDYTRLFLGPVDPRARPYEASWLKDGVLMQDATLDVLAHYREGGFEIDEEFRDLPDHIAVELEFVYALTFEQARAGVAGETAARAAAAGLQRRFVERHLGAWVGPFTAALHAGAETAFYRELAAFTADWVRHLDDGAALH